MNRVRVELDSDDGYWLDIDLRQLVSIRQVSPGRLEIEIINDAGQRIQGVFWYSDNRIPNKERVTARFQ